MAEHVWQDVPQPEALGGGRYRPKWNSVALFFNLTDDDRPEDYEETSAAAVQAWLDEGGAPAVPPISEFMANYWGTLSYGRFAFGLVSPTREGRPLIPRLEVPDGDPHDYGGLIRRYLDEDAAAVWRAAGSLERDGHRFVPSVVLVHRYWSGAWADGGWIQSAGGRDYEIGRITHMPYALAFVGAPGAVDPPGVPDNRVRQFWGTLAHEYSHNFLDFGDLYGPSGCTGYWDLLGDNSPPGRMSEVSSVHKAQVGWLRFREVIEGPHAEERTIALRPYTTSGDAIKVVPDPQQVPVEYFVLEYRARTDDELWVPDRGLTDRGLLITHVNERLGIPPTWLNREAPYFDPEFADFSDQGTTLWTGWDRLEGVLFTGAAGRDRFTPDSQPSSALYGPRRSGLHITDITVAPKRLTFRLRLDLRPMPRPGTVTALGGWLCSDDDSAVAGRFTPAAGSAGAEIAIQNDRSLGLLRHRQGQWLLHSRQHLTAGEWPLNVPQVHRVGDFDGDGLDELFARTTGAATRIAILKWRDHGFTPVATANGRIDGVDLAQDAVSLAANLDGRGHEILLFSADQVSVVRLAAGGLNLVAHQQGRIDAWSLRAIDRRTAGRFTQPKLDEVLLRSDNWLGLLGWDVRDRRLRLRSIQEDRIDGWNLKPDDRHAVADVDGDGLDEVYLRSDRWAAVLKWSRDRFRVAWMAEGRIDNWLDDADPPSLTLAAGDTFRAMRAFRDRDAILHRAGSTLSLLTWEDGAIRLRDRLASPFHGRWDLDARDRIVVGDFHRIGPDIADPTQDFIQDRLDDIFIHAARGTAMLGINHIPDSEAPGGLQDQFGLTWVSGRSLHTDR